MAKRYQRDTKATEEKTWFETNVYICRWRIRVCKFGIGWRTAVRSKWFRGAAFRNQREPVRVLRAFSLWIQWGTH